MKKAVVVDTSIAIKWLLEEADSDKADMLLSDWSKNKLVLLVPALLAYEVANGLYQSVRKGEITLEMAKEALEDLLRTKMKFDFPRTLDLSKRAIELAERYNLPATYDPHYLALAEREGCEFWTADTRMWRAVKGELPWVRLLDDYSPSKK